MAIEKWMGDAAIAGANSTKGLLPSSLTVTYLAVAPRHTSLLRRSSSCSTVAQERRSLYWLDVVSCFNGCRAKKGQKWEGSAIAVIAHKSHHV